VCDHICAHGHGGVFIEYSYTHKIECVVNGVWCIVCLYMCTDLFLRCGRVRAYAQGVGVWMFGQSEKMGGGRVGGGSLLFLFRALSLALWTSHVLHASTSYVTHAQIRTWK